MFSWTIWTLRHNSSYIGCEYDEDIDS